MLAASAADTGRVIYRALKLLSLFCCTLVVLSFALFARDQMAGASANQQSQLATGSNAPVASVKSHAQPRRFIDSASKELTAPFEAVVQSDNAWVKHGLPAIFALVVYGLGLGYLARFVGLAGHTAG